MNATTLIRFSAISVGLAAGMFSVAQDGGVLIGDQLPSPPLGLNAPAGSKTNAVGTKTIPCENIAMTVPTNWWSPAKGTNRYGYDVKCQVSGFRWGRPAGRFCGGDSK